MRNFTAFFLFFLAAGTTWAAEAPADWKMYKDPLHGFEVSYPATWQLQASSHHESGGPLVQLDGGSEGAVGIVYFGDDLNFSDYGPDEQPGQRPTMGLDQFMQLAGDALGQTTHTTLNGLNAYEIATHVRVEEAEPNANNQRTTEIFAVMVEHQGQAFQLRFHHGPTKQDLTETERRILASFHFVH